MEIVEFDEPRPIDINGDEDLLNIQKYSTIPTRLEIIGVMRSQRI